VRALDVRRVLADDGDDLAEEALCTQWMDVRAMKMARGAGPVDRCRGDESILPVARGPAYSTGM